MKRLITVITIIAISATAAFSQNSAQQKTMEEVKQYIDENVFPLIEKQQTKYYNALSDSEKTELSNIKEQNSHPKNELVKITDVHPKLNASYKKVIDKNKAIWIADIKAIHENNDTQPMHSKDGNIGIEMFFTRMSNSEWLLLWDSENPRKAHPRGMRTQNNTGNYKPAAGKRNFNPELRAEIKTYTIENVLPVIAQERKDFDKVLSTDEKKIIETARQKVEVRKIMFKSWYESEDFEVGKRAKDPNFDNMRTDMQNSMTEVREIAIAHSDEIREAIAKIKTHSDSWRKDISAISERNNQDPKHTNRMIMQKMHKSQTPISFLLFNTNKVDETDLFDFDKEDDVKVIVYPNPVFENATIAIINAVNENVQITLFTKGGEKVLDLYDDQNKKQRLEVLLNVSDLRDDVYLIKVATGDINITRKIVIKH